MSDHIKQAVREVVASIKNLKISGIPEEWFPEKRDSQETAAPGIPMTYQLPSLTDSPLASQITVSTIATQQAVSPAYAASTSHVTPLTEESSLDWADLKAKAKVCTKCRLCETRSNVVFGIGKRESPLIAFVGEGPGADEDRLGEPFVGRAGALLTAAITKGLGLRREDVYIANVVKCRPPQNRAPLPDEVLACTPYLYRQLELLRPQVIVTLGQPAQMALSGVNIGITKLRGQWQSWRGIKLMPTFHPAYLLRNPPVKRLFWEDLQAVMQELRLPGCGG